MSQSATGLFDGSLRPGVYRLVGAPPRRMADGLTEAGWRTVRLGPATDLDAFYRELSDALGLPDWFGANLDALWDVLTDLETPTALVLEDWTRFATARPDAWSRVLDVLTERTESEPPASQTPASHHPANQPPFAVVLA